MGREYRALIHLAEGSREWRPSRRVFQRASEAQAYQRRLQPRWDKAKADERARRAREARREGKWIDGWTARAWAACVRIGRAIASADHCLAGRR